MSERRREMTTTTDERREIRVIVAQAKIVLESETPASTRVAKTVMALERLLPVPGSPDYRDAFQSAHARLRKGET
jgi:hypothetical protein